MLGWLFRVIVGRFGCEHKDEVLEQYRVKTSDRERDAELLYILQCNKCGRVKRKKFDI